jgi:cell pole-organizing protein PopZ
MAQENAEQEPTMEEILASIRRIINEDEDEKPGEASEPEAAPEPEAEAAVPEAEPELAPEPEPEPVFEAEPEVAAEPLAEPDEDDVLELTDRVEDEPEPASEPMSVDDDLMILDREDEEPEPAPAPTPSPAPQPVAEEEDNLVDDVPASAASGMFAALSENLRVSSDQGQTLEGIVRELLRPMLKQWLDENLPTIVEEKVQAEIERIARRRR